MIYSDFQDLKLSHLGFGTMRLPLLADGSGQIDEAQTAQMVQYAFDHVINYFDTAYPYHGRMSETVIGKILKNYPRDSFYLATKYPGHQAAKSYDPAVIFEEQLQKCQVDYFDFYLLHNVNENSVSTYLDDKWGIVDYFVAQKKAGRIRHLGFSTHAYPDTMRAFLDKYGDVMEFCQIQLNYLDWTLQDAKEKYELLTERGIPVWVMEPVRGGKLASLSEENKEKLKTFRPEESEPAWAFRFLQGLPNVKMILSGMSNLTQMAENIQTFEEEKTLNEEELQAILEVAETLKDSVPCTACRYCVEGCPKQLDIPKLLAMYNEMRVSSSIIIRINMDSMDVSKHPSACIGCGKCAKSCPQKIDIPAAMKDFAKRMEEYPSWVEICRQREEAAKQKNK